MRPGLWRTFFHFVIVPIPFLWFVLWLFGSGSSAIRVVVPVAYTAGLLIFRRYLKERWGEFHPALEISLALALAAVAFPTLFLQARVWGYHLFSRATPSPEDAKKIYQCDAIKADVNRILADLQPIMEARQKGTYNNDNKIKAREASLLAELDLANARSREQGCSIQAATIQPPPSSPNPTVSGTAAESAHPSRAEMGRSAASTQDRDLKSIIAGLQHTENRIAVVLNSPADAEFESMLYSQLQEQDSRITVQLIDASWFKSEGYFDRALRGDTRTLQAAGLFNKLDHLLVGQLSKTCSQGSAIGVELKTCTGTVQYRYIGRSGVSDATGQVSATASDSDDNGARLALARHLSTDWLRRISIGER